MLRISCFLAAFLWTLGGYAYAGPMGTMSVRELNLPGRVLDLAFGDLNNDGLQDALVAHLIGDGEADAQGRQRRLISLFLQSPDPTNRWAKAPSASLEISQDVSLFSLADFLPEPGQELILMTAVGLRIYRYKVEIKGFEALTPITSPETGFFEFPADGGLFQWDLTPQLFEPLAGILFPTKSGYIIYGHRRDGFAERGRIDVPSEERFGPALETQFLNRLLTYFSRLPRVVALDMNGDKRLDLVAYRSKGLASFLQRPDGHFEAKPDKLQPLKIVESVKDEAKKKDDAKDAFESVQLSLRDLNNDGRVDLVATKTLGKVGVFESLRSQILVFLAAKEGLQDEKPDRIINLKGISLFPEFTDFNGDKDTDIVLSSLRVDLLTNIKRAILDSVSTTYTVYLFRGGERVYSPEADLERSVDVALDLVEKQGQARLTFFSGDFNGDGIKDMLNVAARDKLLIVPGAIKSSFFSGKYLALDDDVKVEVPIATSPSLIIRDLNGDKKDELVLIYKRVDDPDRTRIRILEAGS